MSKKRPPTAGDRAPIDIDQLRWAPAVNFPTPTQRSQNYVP